MKSIGGMKIADAIADPESVFSQPSDVVDLEGVCNTDKLAILESWKSLVDEADDPETVAKKINLAIKQLNG